MAAFCTADPVPGDSRHEFRFLAGYSLQSAMLIGTTSDARFVAAGFEYSYRCRAWTPVSISFTAGIRPATVQKAPIYATFLLHADSGRWVYGFGVTPLGFTFDFARTRTIY